VSILVASARSTMAGRPHRKTTAGRECRHRQQVGLLNRSHIFWPRVKKSAAVRRSTYPHPVSVKSARGNRAGHHGDGHRLTSKSQHHGAGSSHHLRTALRCAVATSAERNDLRPVARETMTTAGSQERRNRCLRDRSANALGTPIPPTPISTAGPSASPPPVAGQRL
jgi:hypothetical protein